MGCSSWASARGHAGLSGSLPSWTDSTLTISGALMSLVACVVVMTSSEPVAKGRKWLTAQVEPVENARNRIAVCGRRRQLTRDERGGQRRTTVAEKKSRSTKWNGMCSRVQMSALRLPTALASARASSRETGRRTIVPGVEALEREHVDLRITEREYFSEDGRCDTRGRR